MNTDVKNVVILTLDLKEVEAELLELYSKEVVTMLINSLNKS